MVPIFDPAPQHQLFGDKVNQAIHNVLASGQYILGPEVRTFEQEAADYHGVKHAISVASGTDALHLALRAAGIGEGDEVITPPFTFIATLEAIMYCGATAVFADIDEATMNLDPDAVASVITQRSKAILPVHLFGLPADMEPLQKLASAHNLKIIEDCAQAFGARYKETPVGSLGEAGCFSFFPTKNLGGYGDGGLITTNSDSLAEGIRTLRNHGSRERYHHHEVGYNSRLDELQAAGLRIKLRHIEALNQSRRNIADLYARELADVAIELPVVAQGCHHVYGQYTVQLEERNTVKKHLDELGIGTAIYYPIPLHRQELCVSKYGDQSFPVAERVAKRCLSLPMFPGMTEEQGVEVTTALRQALA